MHRSHAKIWLTTSTWALLVGALVATSVVALPGQASADEMDIALSRLRMQQDPSVDLTTACPVGGNRWCGDDAAYRNLIAQYGMALAPPVLAPARTLGHRGFYMGFETNLTGIDNDASYWNRGTEGDGMSTFDTGNRFVNNMLVWSRATIRKGLPFGFELSGSFGSAYNTNLWMAGVGLKLALLEGYHEGFLGWMPDVSIGGSVHTMIGDSEFSLTVPSLDIILSKPIVVASAARITPIVGAQIMWIIADSELVDLSPGTNAFGQCLPETGPPSVGDSGTIRCTSGTSSDFENHHVFPEVRSVRVRIALGAELTYQRLTLSGTFHFDVAPPNDYDEDISEDVPRQWSLALGSGVNF